METFTIGLRRPWWVGALGRNALVRRSDRIEAIAVVLAVLFSVLAIPVAAAIGTSVHDQRARTYAQEAQNRHQVTATATADGHAAAQLRTIVFFAEATWSEAGRTHRGDVEWPGRAKAGDHQTIWVNDKGDLAAPPSPSSRADSEAVSVALVVWLAVTEAAAGLAYLVRHRLDRRRYAQWDREINASHNNKGRRNHRS